MAFNSFEFLVYFPLVVGGYFALPWRWRPHFLLAASCIFYMAARADYIVLIGGATLVTYAAARGIETANTPANKRRYLTAGLLLVLSVLFLFKYFDFVNDSMRSLFTAMGIPYGVANLGLILPIGISFYTFQLVGYLIDVYRGKLPAERNLGKFSLFVTFFPQLVAGPIERATNLLPQLGVRHDFDYQRMVSGLRLMAWGLFKKVAISDQLAPLVERVFSEPGAYDAASLMLGTVFFAFQVYCDFSGYSDIAIGAARTMGIRLMENFRQPYFALSIGEFWKRWHISLSTWLTDYVYNHFIKAEWLRLKWYPKFLASLFLTFLVSGVWHGANWTFIAWGALHGSYLVCSMLTAKPRKRLVSWSGIDRFPMAHAVLRMLLTFGLVCVSYVFFRANTLGDAFEILWRVSTFAGGDTLAGAKCVVAMMMIGVVVAADAVALQGNVGEWFATRPAWIRWAVYHGWAAAVLVFGAFGGEAQRFIYFQF